MTPEDNNEWLRDSYLEQNTEDDGVSKDARESSPTPPSGGRPPNDRTLRDDQKNDFIAATVIAIQQFASHGIEGAIEVFVLVLGILKSLRLIWPKWEKWHRRTPLLKRLPFHSASFLLLIFLAGCSYAVYYVATDENKRGGPHHGEDQQQNSPLPFPLSDDDEGKEHPITGK